MYPETSQNLGGISPTPELPIDEPITENNEDAAVYETPGLAIAGGDSDQVSLASERDWDIAHSAQSRRNSAAGWRARAGSTASSAAKETMQSQAIENDESAEAIETWAAILYDHPVSEAYSRLHKGILFTPKSLVVIETRVQDALQRMMVLEGILQSLPTTSAFEGVTNPAATDITDKKDLSPPAVMEIACGPRGNEHSENGKAMWRAYDGLLANESTTLGQLRDFYRDAFRYAFITPTLNYAKRTKSMLEDVRLGRASQ